MSSSALNLTINVLGVREEDSWCAIALEMSLRGYGETFDDALTDLIAAIEAQLSFAAQHGTIDQVFIPAEPEYIRLYADRKREAVKRKLYGLEQTGRLPGYVVGDVALPERLERAFTEVSTAANATIPSLTTARRRSST